MCNGNCSCKCSGLIERIGMYTRTAQQLELKASAGRRDARDLEGKAASLREQAQKLQERINRGER